MSETPYAVHDRSMLEEFKELANKPNEDIAFIINDWEPTKKALFLRTLPKEMFADIFYLLDDDVRLSVLQTLTQPEVMDLIDEMASDELVDTLQELPANVVTALLNKIDPQRRDVINRLLNYPPESVGSLMTVEYLAVKEGATRSQIQEKLSQSDADSEHLLEIYVMSPTRELVGEIALGDFARWSKEDVRPLIHTDLVTVTATDDQEIAARDFRKYHRVILPVVDSENRLLGVVTADDIFEVIEDELFEDMGRQQGLSYPQDHEPYLETPVKNFFKARIVWLMVLMISATLTGMVVAHYEALLAANVVLASFIPMLMDSAGNAGEQASTTVIRAVTLEEVNPHSFVQVAFKEMRIGLCCGLVLALVNFCRLYFFTATSFHIALVVSVTLIFTLTVAKMIGGILPLFAVTLKQDPAVMAGPLLTTIADTVTLLLFFEFSSLMLGLQNIPLS